MNTAGSYTCRCLPGYVGNGFKCKGSDEALAQLEGSYKTLGEGQLACDEGSSVPYPMGAPGFAYDPLAEPDGNQVGEERWNFVVLHFIAIEYKMLCDQSAQHL